MTDTKPMRIGRLSRRTGASVKALRFYDSQGLLLTAGRSAANYRLFPEDAVTCVDSVRALKAAGLTIREIRELAAAYRAGGDPNVLLRRKLTQVLERLNREESELQVRRARLVTLLGDVQSWCRQPALARPSPEPDRR